LSVSRSASFTCGERIFDTLWAGGFVGARDSTGEMTKNKFPAKEKNLVVHLAANRHIHRDSIQLRIYLSGDLRTQRATTRIKERKIYAQFINLKE
jgi:hypothetical protein